ncbi:PREDICTED: TPR repeat-containing thioredoxin TTL1 [Tarenaya hassleriana]|uniref:TPR repeat-containing thioredoxin TTL1 n=1 Tax=Tarenaya hassleriana TaxID=28532 RepID=UPI00053C98F8|nr:PREDICTED: TPR repeat-containing thioredoxin TTL1 [Tarenaya hassleriana]
MSQKPTRDSASDGLPDRLCDSVSSDFNKPDFRELDLGSPVSPLRTRPGGLAAAAVTTSSSSASSAGSVSGRVGPNSATRRPDSGRSTHSGDLSGSSESSPKAAAIRNPRPSQTRSDSGTTQPLIYSGQSSSATSPAINVLPAGNILPPGRVLKTGMATSRSTRTDVLGSGTGTYGHGSIMRGTGSSVSAAKPSSSGGAGGSPGHISGSPATVGSPSRGGSSGDLLMKKAISSSDSEEVKRIGNEMYKKGNFVDALRLYDRAIVLSPRNAACRGNRAAALMGLKRIGEAIKECEEALRLDPNYGRAHQRLASLFIRMGQVESASNHLRFLGNQSDPTESQKVQAIDAHLNKCTDARKRGDWRTVLKEVDAAIACGADFSPHLVLCKVEALVKLNKLDDARITLSEVPIVEPFPASCSQNRFSGMICEAYTYFVKSQIEMALGRFEGAVTAAEKASQRDPRNNEVSMLVNSVTLVARARTRGNELYKSERYTEACSAYEEGLRLDPSNAVLYCNRAACWFKLGMWEHTIEDCNQALHIQPKYTKPLLRRAASYRKLEKWADAVRDYEALRRELPDDKEVAESLFHAQVALRKSRGEEVSNMKFGGEVEEVSSLEQFRAAVSLPGVSVVHFLKASDSRCKEISPFVDTLCTRYPSVNFFQVDIDKCPEITSAENVRVVPTFKIHKNGIRAKEIICPNREVLEYSVRHYNSLSL